MPTLLSAAELLISIVGSAVAALAVLFASRASLLAKRNLDLVKYIIDGGRTEFFDPNRELSQELVRYFNYENKVKSAVLKLTHEVKEPNLAGTADFLANIDGRLAAIEVKIYFKFITQSYITDMIERSGADLLCFVTPEPLDKDRIERLLENVPAGKVSFVHGDDEATLVRNLKEATIDN